MPRGDGTGPRGQGPETDRGIGRGGGRSARGGGFGAGPGGYCVCPSCGERVLHRPAKPCFQQKCLKCGAEFLVLKKTKSKGETLQCLKCKYEKAIEAPSPELTRKDAKA